MLFILNVVIVKYYKKKKPYKKCLPILYYVICKKKIFEIINRKIVKIKITYLGILIVL